jgi:transcriptional regulator with XRE-family HTH domain
MPAIRQRLDLTAQEFAERVRGLGLKFDRGTVSKIENGLRGVSLDEALIIAAALDVAPVHLFLPRDDNDKVGIGNIPVTAYQARRWFRGQEPLPGRDDKPFRTEVPESEWHRKTARVALAEEDEQVKYRQYRVAKEKLDIITAELARPESFNVELSFEKSRARERERERLDRRYEVALEAVAEAKVEWEDARDHWRRVKAEESRSGGE